MLQNSQTNERLMPTHRAPCLSQMIHECLATSAFGGKAEIGSSTAIYEYVGWARAPTGPRGARISQFEGVRRGVLIAESLWPNSAYADGRGINTFTGADSVAPFGGAAFHDNKVWLRKAV
jgi:hypothetical protein